MHLPDSTDIVIVGAGPVGMTVANLLANYGVKTLVLDRAQAILEHPRAIGTDNDGLRVLQAAGLARDAFELIPMARLEMLAPRMGMVLQAPLAGCINSFPALAMFYQPDMERALQSKAEVQDLIIVCRGVEFVSASQDEDGAVVEVKDDAGALKEIACQYVVGADGANSQLREQIGQTFTGRDYGEDWLIVDAIGREAHTHGATIDHVMFYCDPKRPYPHMPAPGGRERWEFKLKKGEDRDHFLQDDVIKDLLKEWYPKGDAQIERKAIYRFQARAAKKFSEGRVFLVGDAAHVMPPFAGQGLVSGQRDAYNLAWKLAWVVKGFAGPHLLETYSQERRPHVVATTRLARFIGSIVMPRNATAQILIHSLIKTIRKVPFIHKRMDGVEMKPNNIFKKGFFLKRAGHGKLQPGAQFPQMRLVHKDGRQCWSDDLAQGQLRMIGFGVDPDVHLSSEALTALQALGGVSVQICYGGQVFHRTDHALCWEDQDGNAIPAIANDGWCALVRPDQVVVAAGPIENATQIIADAQNLFAPQIRNMK